MITRAIISSIIPYSESSLICKVLTEQHGNISIIAKGIRKQKQILSRLWEYELNLSEPKEEGLYLLKEAREQRDFSSYPSSETWAAAECGIELLSNLLIPASEAEEYYALLCNYLGYLQGVSKNAILLLWRLFLRVFQMNGIRMEIKLCSQCHCDKAIMGCTRSGELICMECYQAAPGTYLQLNPLSTRILDLLPEIGKHLNVLSLNRQVVNELNDLFRDYYQFHHKQKLRLKSLSVLSQYYPKA